MTPPRSTSHPETPFGARLRAARKMAGLSMEDLAGKLGGRVTKQAISKYEQGRMMPSPDVLEQLVEVLKIATWGASPLRPSDRDLNDAALGEGPALFAEERIASPKLRRAGLLKRLRHMGRETERSENVSSPALPAPSGPAAASQSLTRSLTDSPPKDESRYLFLGERVSDPAPMILNGPRDAALAPYPGLAARRARAARDWASAASLDSIRFRAGEKLGAKTEEALKYRIADYLGRCQELEAILGQAAPFENPIAGRPVDAPQAVEEAAAEVRRRWDLGTGPVVNLLGLLEDKGIKVYETRGIEGFEGLSGRFGEAPFVAVAMENPADRIRFTAAHELGHILCDFGGAESPEGECHAFGAAFLLPRAALERAFSPARRKVTLGDLGEIKRTYGVSLQAIMYRARGLGLVSDRQLRSFRETLKARGWLVEEPVAYDGPERAARFRRLLRYAVAAGILDLGRAAGLAGLPAAELEKEIGEIF